MAELISFETTLAITLKRQTTTVGDCVMEFLSPKDKDLVALTGTCAQMARLAQSFCQRIVQKYLRSIRDCCPEKMREDYECRMDAKWNCLLYRFSSESSWFMTAKLNPVLLRKPSHAWCLWNLLRDPVLNFKNAFVELMGRAAGQHILNFLSPEHSDVVSLAVTCTLLGSIVQKFATPNIRKLYLGQRRLLH